MRIYTFRNHVLQILKKQQQSLETPKKKHTLISRNLSGFDVTTSPQFHQARYGKIYLWLLKETPRDWYPSSPTSGSRTMLRECLKQLDVADSSLGQEAKRSPSFGLSKETAYSYFTKKTIWKILKTVCIKYISNYSIVAETWHLDFRCAAYTVYIKVHQPNSINFLGMLRFRDLFVGLRAIDSITS